MQQMTISELTKIDETVLKAAEEKHEEQQQKKEAEVTEESQDSNESQ